MTYVYIISILLLRIVQSIFGKKASVLMPYKTVPFLKYTVVYKAVATVFCTILLIVDLAAGKNIIPDAGTVIYACISGLFLVISSSCSLYSMKKGTMALNSLFSTAGLLIPCVAGIFLFDESMTVMQFVALGLFFISAYLLIASSRKIYSDFSFSTFVLLLLGLISNGAVMLMQKLFGIGIPDGNVTVFSFFTFFSATVLTLIVLIAAFLLHKSNNTETSPDVEHVPKKLYYYGTLLAFAVFIINQFATISGRTVSAVVLFSIINGGATIISAAVGAICFKEKLTLRSVVGILLGIASLIIIKLAA